jgi:hypothetical protein
MDQRIVLALAFLVAAYLFWHFLGSSMISALSGGVRGSQKYKVTFTSDWGTNANINHPSDPHTGNMFLMTSRNDFDLFSVGDLASKGISQTSMYGTLDELLVLVKGKSNVGSVVTAPVLKLPGTATMNITADQANPYLSFATMIAPSPDWFTGISRLDLREGGNWVKSKTMPLYVYDAGTDSGTGFAVEHILETAARPIAIKTDSFLYPQGRVEPIGYLKIEAV